MKTLIAAILLVASSIAAAAPNNNKGGGSSGNSGGSGGSSSSSVGSASASDVTLGGLSANKFVLASGNAQAGQNGDSSLFSSTFGGSWSLLGKVGSNGALTGATSPVLGSTITVTFGLANGSKSGTWSITSSKSLQMDLVLGIHAGNATGSFLFDNLTLLAGKTQTGTFAINWNNNGGQVPAFSNLTLFTSSASTVSLRSVAPVPEPSTYAMLLAGLAMVGCLAWRRRSKLAAPTPLGAA